MYGIGSARALTPVIDDHQADQKHNAAARPLASTGAVAYLQSPAPTAPWYGSTTSLAAATGALTGAARPAEAPIGTRTTLPTAAAQASGPAHAAAAGLGRALLDPGRLAVADRQTSSGLHASNASIARREKLRDDMVGLVNARVPRNELVTLSAACRRQYERQDAKELATEVMHVVRSAPHCRAASAPGLSSEALRQRWGTVATEVYGAMAKHLDATQKLELAREILTQVHQAPVPEAHGEVVFVALFLSVFEVLHPTGALGGSAPAQDARAFLGAILDTPAPNRLYAFHAHAFRAHELSGGNAGVNLLTCPMNPASDLNEAFAMRQHLFMQHCRDIDVHRALDRMPYPDTEPQRTQQLVFRSLAYRPAYEADVDDARARQRAVARQDQEYQRLLALPKTPLTEQEFLNRKARLIALCHQIDEPGGVRKARIAETARLVHLPMAGADPKLREQFLDLIATAQTYTILHPARAPAGTYKYLSSPPETPQRGRPVPWSEADLAARAAVARMLSRYLEPGQRLGLDKILRGDGLAKWSIGEQRRVNQAIVNALWKDQPQPYEQKVLSTVRKAVSPTTPQTEVRFLETCDQLDRLLDSDFQLENSGVYVQCWNAMLDFLSDPKMDAALRINQIIRLVEHGRATLTPELFNKARDIVLSATHTMAQPTAGLDTPRIAAMTELYAAMYEGPRAAAPASFKQPAFFAQQQKFLSQRVDASTQAEVQDQALRDVGAMENFERQGLSGNLRALAARHAVTPGVAAEARPAAPAADPPVARSDGKHGR